LKQPRLKQWQRLTEKKFNEIVTFEIQRQLYKEYLTDVRVYQLLKSGETAKQQFIDNMRRLFFESFPAILADLKLPSDVSVYVTWHNLGETIEWWNIIHGTEMVEYKEEHDIILPFRYIYLRIQDSWPHYYMPLTERINLIVNYILKRNIHGESKLLEEAKSYKYDSTPITTSRGYRVIPHDWTNLLRMLGQEYGKMLATMERDIWQPQQRKDSDSLIRIGRLFYG
jgi:hypothetical protein